MKSKKPPIISRATIRFFVALITLSQFGCKSQEKGEKMDSKDRLEYYTTQGIMTDPGKYVYLYKELPSDVEKLVEVVQGVMIHIFHAHRHGIELSDERKQEVQIRKVEDMLEQIIELDDRPIIAARDPTKRLVGNCRNYSAFICSLLRHKDIPSRARCGFTTYFPLEGGLTHGDHWICEYWRSSERRWVQIDAQIDSLQKKAFQFKFNILDLPKGKFLSGGEVWELCRSGKLDPNLCGIFDLKGSWFVKDNVLRDLMALNKLEILPWDCNEFMESSRELNEEDYTLLDKIAESTTAGDKCFSKVRSLYESNSDLRMPANSKP